MERNVSKDLRNSMRDFGEEWRKNEGM